MLLKKNHPHIRILKDPTLFATATATPELCEQLVADWMNIEMNALMQQGIVLTKLPRKIFEPIKTLIETKDIGVDDKLNQLRKFRLLFNDDYSKMKMELFCYDNFKELFDFYADFKHAQFDEAVSCCYDRSHYDILCNLFIVRLMIAAQMLIEIEHYADRLQQSELKDGLRRAMFDFTLKSQQIANYQRNLSMNKLSFVAGLYRMSVYSLIMVQIGTISLSRLSNAEKQADDLKFFLNFNTLVTLITLVAWGLYNYFEHVKDKLLCRDFEISKISLGLRFLDLRDMESLPSRQDGFKA